MAFLAEVRARLGLDTEEFRRKLTQTQAEVGTAAKDMGNKLKASFGAGGVFKGFLQGLGFGAVQSVVDKLVSGFREAAEQAEKIANLTETTADIYERIFAGRRTDEQNLTANQQKQARTLQEIENTRAKTEKRLTTVSTGVGGVSVMEEEVVKEDEPLKRAELEKELAKLAEEEAKLKERIADKAETAAKTELDNAEKVYAAEQRMGELEAANKAKQQTTLEQIATTEEEIRNLRTTIALSGDADFSRRIRLKELEGSLLDLQKKQTDELEKQNKERDEAEKKLRDAYSDASKARLEESEAKRERSALTLEEVASGASESSQTQRARARRVMMLEARAKRQRAQGFEAEALSTTDQALELRKGIVGLRSEEADPMAKAAEKIVESEAHLREIRNELKSTTLR